MEGSVGGGGPISKGWTDGVISQEKFRLKRRKRVVADERPASEYAAVRSAEPIEQSEQGVISRLWRRLIG